MLNSANAQGSHVVQSSNLQTLRNLLKLARLVCTIWNQLVLCQNLKLFYDCHYWSCYNYYLSEIQLWSSLLMCLKDIHWLSPLTSVTLANKGWTVMLYLSTIFICPKYHSSKLIDVLHSNDAVSMMKLYLRRTLI